MTSYKIKVLSDVHLETHGNNYPSLYDLISEDDDIDIICLCGDIGDPDDVSYIHFMKECADKCKLYTFVIMGNHEAYGKTINETREAIEDICGLVNKDKLIFLDNSSFMLNPKLRIIGTTLWTKIEAEESWDISCRIADFVNIYGWNIAMCNNLHHNAVEFISKELSEARESKQDVIIMTHHAPLMTLQNPEYKNCDLQHAYAVDLYNLLKANTDVIKAWFYGHNHYSMKAEIDDTLVLSNQVGYPGEKCTRYDNSLIVEIRRQ